MTILEQNIERYCVVSINKLLRTNKEKIVEIELKQNDIQNKIQSLKSDGFDYIDNIYILQNKYKELELLKPQIEWHKLISKAKKDIVDRFPQFDKNLIIESIYKITNKLKNNNYSLSSFRKFNNLSAKKYYRKKQEIKGEEVMTREERNKETAAIKREKSLSIIKEVLNKLVAVEKKQTSKNVYEIIKNDYNDCLKIRQIKTYLKQIKEENQKKVIDCTDMTIEQIEDLINNS